MVSMFIDDVSGQHRFNGLELMGRLPNRHFYRAGRNTDPGPRFSVKAGNNMLSAAAETNAVGYHVGHLNNGGFFGRTGAGR